MINISFDVESVGLYGPGFAVAGVLTDNEGRHLQDFSFSRGMPSINLPEQLRGTYDIDQWKADHEWVSANVVPHLPETNCDDLDEVRSRFVALLKKCKDETGVNPRLIADCAFPVETNFLAACVNRHAARGLMPYPLIDISSMLLAQGFNPVGTHARLPDELPAHNPLNDARQTSRLYHDLLRAAEYGD